MYYIYKMIHPQSGRVYIGQHKAKRGCVDYVNDGYFGSGKIWTRIYKKHPNECIKVILEVAETKEEIDALEIKYIAHYKEVWGDYCVNIAKGGRAGGPEKRFTEEELKEHRRQHRRLYRQTPQGQAAIKAYRESEKYKTYEKERRKTEKYKKQSAARQRKYRQNHLEEIREKDRQRAKIRREKKEFEDKP